MTINTIIHKVLKPIANDHLMLNEFGFGDLHNYAKVNALAYPVMWVALNDVGYKGKGFNYNLSLVFADILKDDLSNTLEIQSDMISIAADIAAKLFYTDNDYLEVTSDFVFKPFTERFTDLCAGVVMDINIKSLVILSPCDFASIEDLQNPRLMTEKGEEIIQQNGQHITI